MTEPGIYFEHPTSAAAIFRSAAEFGVSQDEIWETAVATFDRLPGDMQAIYIEELTPALATRLLENEEQRFRCSSSGNYNK